jgi:hypothetical protein
MKKLAACLPLFLLFLHEAIAQNTTSHAVDACIRSSKSRFNRYQPNKIIQLVFKIFQKIFAPTKIISKLHAKSVSYELCRKEFKAFT